MTDTTMEHTKNLAGTVDYTVNLFREKWTRWLILFIFGLPMALVPFVFDTDRMITGKRIIWEAVPWGQLAVLLLAMVIFTILTSGYMVRIYRGGKPAPDFDDWGNLFVDGIKLFIVTITWFLPFLASMICWLVITPMASPAGGVKNSPLALGVFLVFMLLVIVTLLIALFFSPMGMIRFARTGSIAEGLRYSEIQEIIRKVGWVQYIIALLILLVVMFLFNLVSFILALVPIAGWIFKPALSPLFMVFIARYYTCIYEQAERLPVSG